MLYYNLGANVRASSTNIGDAIDPAIVLPQHQAHGVQVRRIPEEADDLTGVDALISNHAGIKIGVKTADCTPILLYDPAHHAIAAIHSGWRGTVQNIIAHTLKRMAEAYGTATADVQAVIGPCIHRAAFEVGDEVYHAFRAILPEVETSLFATHTDKWHIDLPAVCRLQLEACGVKHIQVCEECTYTNHDRFFSARRLGASFDRQRIVNSIEMLGAR